jgi:hypothetical protein
VSFDNLVDFFVSLWSFIREKGHGAIKSPWEDVQCQVAIVVPIKANNFFAIQLI